ncbi:MAG: hypothetical protein KDD47_25340 [Acidobacteria bacterium]|nr:hypothetical protein [Acidobacteriota bacterium]
MKTAPQPLRRRLAFCALMLSALGLLTASVGWAEPVTIGQTDSLFSKVLDEQRDLMVYLPDGYATSEATYPVLYLLDARTRFHHTTGTVATLSDIGQIPEMIVVAVRNTDRTRDLTPPWTGPAPDDSVPGRAGAVEGGGGAGNFLRFLHEELVPYVEGKYRTAPFRILVGHSFGGLFAVHALVHDPDLFDAVLAISPSLWWDGGKSVDQAQALFEKRPDLHGRLFMTLASEGADMLEQYRRMEALLKYRAPAGLSWHSRVVDGEDHGSIPIVSVHAGLKAFFPRWQIPPFVREAGLAAVDAHYASLSGEYGYAIATPEGTINAMGYEALGGGETDKAVEIFRANIERYPSSANVYDSLGEALEAAGKLAEARDNYTRALKVSEGSNDPNRAAYQNHLDGVTAKLAEGK